MRTFLGLALLTLLASAAPLAAQRPAYPEGAEVPRSLTPAEARWIAGHPLGGARAATAPPSGPVHCPPEYAPMDGIFIAWEGTSGFTTVLAQMAAEITTTGDADVYCVVDTSSEISAAQSKIASYGANMARVHFPVKGTDTVWIRDYGPRYVYQGDVRAIVDHTYNRPRPKDDALPAFLAGYFGHAFYEHALVHGGGNFHLDEPGYGYLTRLINNENPGWSQQQIWQVFRDFQSLDVQFFTPLPSSVDSTQHIDMWMQVIADDKVIISDWPAQSGSTQDILCDQAALDMAARGFTVYRTPARKVSTTHYTYTNVVMCNDLVLVPSYTNSSVTAYNAQAVAVYQAALPGKAIVPINSQAVVTSAGVLHCIVMHLPAHRGGVNPTAYLVTPQGGEILRPGETRQVEWISDDDLGVSSADLELSVDGGATWSTVAGGLAAAGSHTWTVPNQRTNQALLRVLVRDAAGNTGSDQADGLFAIAGANDAAFVPYGEGKAGSLGVPALTLSASPVLGAPVSLQLGSALPNSTAKLIRGPARAATPFDGALALVAYDTVLDLPVGPAGAGAFAATVPGNPALAGRSFYWQAWIPDDPAAAGLGWSCSNGLETRLGF
ncbi:MAG: agmatine deiminase family protein [Planctomycetes bacterium]|nr:agmatine deiminase family protein [Planctomycetota bacterium]